MATPTPEEAYRILAFAEQLKKDIKSEFEDIGLATDILTSTADDGVTDIGGILLGLSAKEKEIGWEEMKATEAEITNRLESLGINWTRNDDLEQREWDTDFLGQDTSPYIEIVTSQVTQNAISKYESEYVDGTIPDRPSDKDFFQEIIERDFSSSTE